MADDPKDPAQHGHIVTNLPVARAAKTWADGGWPVEPDPSGTGLTAPFHAPTQGPPPWNVYRVAPQTAMVLSITPEPGGATRFTF